MQTYSAPWVKKMAVVTPSCSEGEGDFGNRLWASLHVPGRPWASLGDGRLGVPGRPAGRTGRPTRMAKKCLGKLANLVRQSVSGLFWVQ